MAQHSTVSCHLIDIPADVLLDGHLEQDKACAVIESDKKDDIDRGE